MSIAMLVPSYPEPSQTFFERQAKGLGAIILTEKLRVDQVIPEDIYCDVIPFAGSSFNSRTVQGKIRILRNFILFRNIDLMPKKEEIAFRKLLVRHNIRVVIAQFGIMGLRAMRPCQAEGIPLIVHFHGFDLSSLYRYLIYRISCRRLVAKANACIVVNSTQRNRLIRIGCPPEKVAVIHCGVPIDDFPAATERNNHFCQFLAVGRMVEKKSPLNTIRAFAHCASVCNGVQLIYIGDGPLMNQAKSLSEELNVSNQIHFLGERPNSYVKNEMLQADVFIQHSVTASNGDQEGWPVAIAEAAACELPIVSTNHAGIVHQVVNGENGFLVSEGDWINMAEKMILLAENPVMRKQMGQFGRRFIQKYGNMDNSIKALKKIVGNVLN